MNPVDLIAKRQQAFESRLATLVYEWYRLRKRMDELDKAIIDVEASIRECEQSKRDVGTYMAIEAAKDQKPAPEATKKA